MVRRTRARVRVRKTLKRKKRTMKRKYRGKGGFSELSFFLQKGLSMFEMQPTPAAGNTSLVPPFPYFQSK